MRAGRLKNRVSLQSYTETQTNTGFPTKTWATVATVWAAVEAKKGNESEEASELVGTLPATIIIRYSSDVSAVNDTYRVLFGTRIFSIESVILPTDRSGSNAYIEMSCVEGKKDSA
jgi:SPP1 family predicted phage head-tail adaptor